MLSHWGTRSDFILKISTAIYEAVTHTSPVYFIFFYFQAIPVVCNAEMQTDWKYPKNAAVQCEPRVFTADEKREIEESPVMTEFIKKVAPRSHLDDLGLVWDDFSEEGAWQNERNWVELLYRLLLSLVFCRSDGGRFKPYLVRYSQPILQWVVCKFIVTK